MPAILLIMALVFFATGHIVVGSVAAALCLLLAWMDGQ